MQNLNNKNSTAGDNFGYDDSDFSDWEKLFSCDFEEFSSPEFNLPDMDGLVRDNQVLNARMAAQNNVKNSKDILCKIGSTSNNAELVGYEPKLYEMKIAKNSGRNMQISTRNTIALNPNMIFPSYQGYETFRNYSSQKNSKIMSSGSADFEKSTQGKIENILKGYTQESFTRIQRSVLNPNSNSQRDVVSEDILKCESTAVSSQRSFGSQTMMISSQGSSGSQAMMISSQGSSGSQAMMTSSQGSFGSQAMMISSQESTGTQDMVISNQEIYGSQDMIISSQESTGSQDMIISSQESSGSQDMIISSQESSKSQAMLVSSQESSKSRGMIVSNQEGFNSQVMIISSQGSSNNQKMIVSTPKKYKVREKSSWKNISNTDLLMELHILKLQNINKRIKNIKNIVNECSRKKNYCNKLKKNRILSLPKKEQESSVKRMKYSLKRKMI